MNLVESRAKSLWSLSPFFQVWKNSSNFASSAAGPEDLKLQIFHHSGFFAKSRRLPRIISVHHVDHFFPMSRAANMRMGTTPGLPEGTRALKSSSHNSKSSEIVLNQLSGPPPKKGRLSCNLGGIFCHQTNRVQLAKGKGQTQKLWDLFFLGGGSKTLKKKQLQWQWDDAKTMPVTWPCR